ncbi:MAG: hypothetical protein AB7U98_12120 [Candidatus Nitrosocosmicus sp.]
MHIIISIDIISDIKVTREINGGLSRHCIIVESSQYPFGSLFND